MSTDRLLRVTVRAGPRRADLALPAGVPVAELLPDLVRCVDGVDAADVHEDRRLVTGGGQVLAGAADLVTQGVGDGAVLAVVSDADPGPPRVHDDLAEVLAEVVDETVPRPPEGVARRLAAAAAVLLLVLAAIAALLRPGTAVAAVAGGVTLVLVAAAVLTSRSKRDPLLAVPLAWAACGYGATTGLAAGGATDAEVAVALAGAAVLLTGLGCAVGLTAERLVVVPPVVVGAVLLAVGTAARISGQDVAVVTGGGLVLAVLLGGFLPWPALDLAGLPAHQVRAVPDVEVGSAAVDVGRVGAASRRAQRVLVVGSGSVGLLVVVGSPLTVALGAPGVALGVACCVAVGLRASRHRAAAVAVPGVACGAVGLLLVAAAALWAQPGWREVLAVSLAPVGVTLLALALVPLRPSPRVARVGDLLEATALVALPPLLVLATGAFDAVRG